MAGADRVRARRRRAFFALNLVTVCSVAVVVLHSFVTDRRRLRELEVAYLKQAPGQGTGLGLSTSYSIVTGRHRGTIALESRSGLTRFTVRLPLESRLVAPPGD
jgi:hypothetical protein